MNLTTTERIVKLKEVPLNSFAELLNLPGQIVYVFMYDKEPMAINFETKEVFDPLERHSPVRLLEDGAKLTVKH